MLTQQTQLLKKKKPAFLFQSHELICNKSQMQLLLSGKKYFRMNITVLFIIHSCVSDWRICIYSWLFWAGEASMRKTSVIFYYLPFFPFLNIFLISVSLFFHLLFHFVCIHCSFYPTKCISHVIQGFKVWLTLLFIFKMIIINTCMAK